MGDPCKMLSVDNFSFSLEVFSDADALNTHPTGGKAPNSDMIQVQQQGPMDVYRLLQHS